MPPVRESHGEYVLPNSAQHTDGPRGLAVPPRAQYHGTWAGAGWAGSIQMART
jgi:hypothetical protein